MTLTPSQLRNVRFRKARHGQVGYDEREVDAFLHRVEATLAGEDTLTAEDVEAVRFAEYRHRGYPAATVDAFLDEVALTLATRTAVDRRDAMSGQVTWPQTPAPNPLVPAESGRAEFGGPVGFGGPVDGEPTFDEAEVDAYLDRITATLAGRDSLDAHDVLTATFNPPKSGRRGYGEAGVKAFLGVASAGLHKLGTRADNVRTLPTPPSSYPAARALTDPHFRRPRPQRSPARTSPPNRGSSFASRAPLPLRHPTPTTPLRSNEHDGESRPGARPGRYDRGEVDAFLDRIRASLTGRDHLSAQDVLTVVFTPAQPGRPGYSEPEFLALVAGMLEKPAAPAARPQPTSGDSPFPPLIAAEIRDVQLRPPPPGERGYVADEVDLLLDRVEATLAGTDILTAQDVDNVRFHEVPAGQGGYDQSEVEALLDLVAENLSADIVRQQSG